MTAGGKRWPVVPTIVVALAVAAMVALGLWQLLDRAPAKEAYLARLAANPSRPPVAFPTRPDPSLLFRRSAAMCLDPAAIRLAGAGAAGFRAIAECRTGAEGPGLLVQLGTTRDAKAAPRWSGGAVSGTIASAPEGRSLLSGLWNRTPARPMLVLDRPVAGLAPNPRPTLESIPNNHRAYAGQWFFFAAVAAIIYVLAVRRRQA